MTRSALAFARAALEAGSEALPAYSHPKSPHRYTQAQLFALMALRAFLKLDYRGLIVRLSEWSDLRKALGLTRVPHYSTIAKAETRLLTRGNASALLETTLSQARRAGLLGSKAERVAIDSTGYENGHTSAYYGRRCGIRKHRFPKVTALMDTRSHLYLSGVMNEGPFPDHREFAPAVSAAHRRVAFVVLLADAGYDSEHAHRLVRETLGARSVIPATSGRPTTRPPTGTYRRRMARRFPNKTYGQRRQIESAFSQDKRRFSSSVAGRDTTARSRQLHLRLLVHNLALIRRRRAATRHRFTRPTALRQRSR